MATPLTEAAGEAHQGFLYGRITTVVGVLPTYEGRLRWGGDQEAFWGDYFNGFKDHNPWTPPERLPTQRRSIEIFGFQIARWERPSNLGRFFMARFGDIARIEAHGVNVRVTLKSGNVFDLDRLAASDFDDGVRAWDARRGVVDLDSRLIRIIEFLPTDRITPASSSLARPIPIQSDHTRGRACHISLPSLVHSGRFAVTQLLLKSGFKRAPEIAQTRVQPLFGR